MLIGVCPTLGSVNFPGAQPHTPMDKCISLTFVLPPVSLPLLVYLGKLPPQTTCLPVGHWGLAVVTIFTHPVARAVLVSL